MPKLTRIDSTCLGFRSFISRNHAWRRCQLEHIDRIMDLLSVAVDRSHAPICIGIAGKSYTVDNGQTQRKWKRESATRLPCVKQNKQQLCRDTCDSADKEGDMLLHNSAQMHGRS